MYNPLERRGLLGLGTATLAMIGLNPVVTEVKGKKKKKKRSQDGCAGCFRNLGSGAEEIFSVGDGAQEEGISLCPAGTRAISGAIVLGNPACAVIEFSPNDTSFTGWKVTISCPEGENSETNGVIAICIS